MRLERAGLYVLPLTLMATVAGVALDALGQDGHSVVIRNGTGAYETKYFPEDIGDARIPYRVGCDGDERTIEADTEIGCENTRTVTLTAVGPLADSVRMRVASGNYHKQPEGPFAEGTLTVVTGYGGNPDCDPDYDRRERIEIGWHIDTEGLPDLEVLEDGVWKIGVNHTCAW